MSYPPPPPNQPPGYPPAGYPPPQGGPGWQPPNQPPKRSKALPIAIAVVAAVLLVAAAVLVPLLVLADDEGPDTADVDATPSASESVDTGNLDLVEEYEDLDPTHVEGDVTYEQSPPVGGNHNATWLDCGVYDVPVREENVVHDLEHGTIWLTYREDLVDDAGVQVLAGQLPRNGILSPYPDQEAPVVITAWGRQLDLVGPEDPRIGLFVDAYGAGETAPEPFASCAGGTPDPNGDTGVTG